ncbi:MAG TPA: hypothetical protein VFA11_13065 [Acidimicrobiales bacterium]|nr:hypothetical protein [Acidimicrobiales bacterium]
MRFHKIGMVAFTGVALLAMSTAASAKPISGSTSTAATGFDVSYPQCSSSLPSAIAFGIVGVNDGIVYSPNPCLAKQYQWAVKATSASTSPETSVSFYANTADPGPSSTHWPKGQLSPKACSADAPSQGCDYDYGWNAATNSYNDAVAAAGSSANIHGDPWWLDVENANSWVDGALNIADLQGAADALAQLSGVTPGFYTNSSSWQSITGSTTAFSGYPAWLPGARNLTGAKSNCTATAPTHGTITLTQYSSSGLDADYDCQ